MNYNSPDNSISINLGLLPTAIISVALVASALMLAARKPENIIVGPAPVYVQPPPVEVQVHTTVRPHITIKKIVIPPHVAAYDTEITVTAPATAKNPIIPDSLKNFGIGVVAGEITNR